MDEEYYLCLDCIKDKYLKNYFKDASKVTSKCIICENVKNVISVSNDVKLIEFCRFLIRYYYPEYEYNTHWGGDDLPSQFYKENPIISHNFNDLSIDDREIDVEDFLYQLFDLNNFKNPIDLYYGYDDDGRGLFVQSISEEKSEIWQEYRKKLLLENFFLLEGKAKISFSKYIEEYKFTLSKDTEYFRARIGFDEKKIEIGISNVKIKVPYESKELSAPPIIKTKAGRANRQGVSFLYLSSDKDTAIGEVRPHPGHYVSVGKFKSNKDLEVIDLRFIDLFKYYDDNKKLKIFKFLNDLSNELSFPILPDQQEDYLITQFISDIIRQLGYDGILFNSSVSEGHNLVIFNTLNFSFVDSSSNLSKITCVNYRYKSIDYHFDLFLDRVIEK